MQNRRVMPGIYKGYPASLKQKDKEERDHTDPMYKPEKAEGAQMKADDQRKAAKEPKLERSYTIDEMTVATMLKGHPQAEEIVGNLFKSKKEKNESGEEFQDGSEDTIGGEGHAEVARPDSIKHEGKPSGIGPNEPGTGTKKASIEDGDLEKSDNLADNLPEEFEDEMEDDDTIPAEKGGAKKSLTLDELTLGHLLKTMGSDRIEEEILKAEAASIYTTPGALSAKRSGGYEGVKMMNELDKFKRKEPSMLDPKKEEPVSSKKSEESDLEKGKGGSEERAEWAKDPEKEKREHMSEKSYSLDFSKSILEAMGLEKGATSVSKEAGGGRATQINYGTKPTTRFKHPKAKSDKKYIHNPAKGTVKVEKEGEKTREIGVSEEAKLKNASMSSEDLIKSLWMQFWQRRSTNMKFSKSVMDRLVFADVDYLGKDLKEGYGKEYIKQTGKHFDKEHEDQYQAQKRHNERNPNYKPSPEFEGAQKKFKEEHAFREKHAKSVLSVFDDILEKGRRRESDRQGPKRVQESEGEGVELPGGSMATMGNPGGSKEKASFERAEPGALKNLKKLAESKDPNDRKAAEAGMKRH